MEPVPPRLPSFPIMDSSDPVRPSFNRPVETLRDVTLKLSVVLGRAELPIEHILQLSKGSVVELDRLAGEPMELLANGRLIARGEIVVIDDRFGFRVTEWIRE